MDSTVEIVCDEPFFSLEEFSGFENFGNGQYTYIIYHFRAKIPRWIRLLVPKGATEMHEEIWDSYPFQKSVISFPKISQKSYIITEKFTASGFNNEQSQLAANSVMRYIDKEAMDNKRVFSSERAVRLRIL